MTTKKYRPSASKNRNRCSFSARRRPSPSSSHDTVSLKRRILRLYPSSTAQIHLRSMSPKYQSRPEDASCIVRIVVPSRNVPDATNNDHPALTFSCGSCGVRIYRTSTLASLSVLSCRVLLSAHTADCPSWTFQILDNGEIDRSVQGQSRMVDSEKFS